MRAAVFDLGRVQPPERPEQRLRGFGIALIAIVQQAHQRRDAERAGHQDDFVVGVGRELAEFADNGGGFAEFRLGQPDIADEAVQVLDQRHHDFPQPRVGRLFHHRCRGDRDILLTFDDHGALPRPRPHGVTLNTNQAMTKGTAGLARLTPPRSRAWPRRARVARGPAHPSSSPVPAVGTSMLMVISAGIARASATRSMPPSPGNIRSVRARQHHFFRRRRPLGRAVAQLPIVQPARGNFGEVADRTSRPVEVQRIHQHAGIGLADLARQSAARSQGQAPLSMA